MDKLYVKTSDIKQITYSHLKYTLLYNDGTQMEYHLTVNPVQFKIQIEVYCDGELTKQFLTSDRESLFLAKKIWSETFPKIMLELNKSEKVYFICSRCGRSTNLVKMRESYCHRCYSEINIIKH